MPNDAIPISRLHSVPRRKKKLKLFDTFKISDYANYQIFCNKRILFEYIVTKITYRMLLWKLTLFLMIKNMYCHFT